MKITYAPRYSSDRVNSIGLQDFWGLTVESVFKGADSGNELIFCVYGLIKLLHSLLFFTLDSF